MDEKHNEQTDPLSRRAHQKKNKQQTVSLPPETTVTKRASLPSSGGHPRKEASVGRNTQKHVSGNAPKIFPPGSPTRRSQKSGGPPPAERGKTHLLPNPKASEIKGGVDITAIHLSQATSQKSETSHQGRAFSERISLKPDQPLLLPLGRNVPAKLSLPDAIEYMRKSGYTAIQLFLGDPDSWQAPLLEPELVLALRHQLASAHFSSIAIHAPFVIDLATEKETIWLHSICLLRTVLYQARLIGASDVVVHITNYKKPFFPARKQKVERIVKAIVTSLADGPHKPLADIRLLLENGCHPDFSLGSTMGPLGNILRALPPAYPVGICLDTAHLWCAGYDLCQEMPTFMQTLEQYIGFDCIQMLHLNDATYECGKRADEHARWGEGQISAQSVEGIRRLLQDPRLAHLVLILETPLPRNEANQLDWEREKEHLHYMKQLLLVP